VSFLLVPLFSGSVAQWLSGTVFHSMSVFERPVWDHHGGLYRSIDLDAPWVASPLFEAKPLPPAFVQFLPITVPSPSKDSKISITPDINKKRRGFTVLQILKEWMGNVRITPIYSHIC
jgi:hypothetical protein